jgi:thymidylate kinase
MIIGIEGVSCTGKTTLARALAVRLADTSVVPCYYHAAPDPSALPSLEVSSEAEQIGALVAHLEIELLRVRRVQAAVARGCRVVLDRTVDTLLAHLRAVGTMTGLDANAQARALVKHQIDQGLAVVPEVTLLLTADHKVLAERAHTRVGMPTLYYDPVFSRGFNSHFQDPVTPVAMTVNAGRPADQVLEHALGLLAPYLDGQR